MPAIPNLETLLLEVRKSLGLKNCHSTNKNKDFRDHRLQLETHRTMMDAELEAIFDALEMDIAARRDVKRNIFQLFGFNQAVAQRVWTCRASARQVVWHVCAYIYAPALGRILANWNLTQAFDPGMPGGEFWFLPTRSEDGTQTTLPVQHVLDWLMDLLGLPMDEVKNELGGERARRANADESIERSLYNWRAGRLPDIASIERYFTDDSQLTFDGIYEAPTERPLAENFASALTFIERKGLLDAEKLRSQIPMTGPGRLEAILAGTAPEDERQEFVRLLAIRYARPAMRTVRLRLRIARMVQDGYARLVEFLCPGVEPTCGDPYRNQVLQLLELAKHAYNLTIEAHRHGKNEAEENAWFEAHLPAVDAATLFLSVLPSRFGHTHEDVSAFLTRRFAKLEPDAPLADLLPVDAMDMPRVAAHRIGQLMEDQEEDRQVEQVRDRVRRSSAWRVLQSVDNYWVASQVAQSLDLPSKARAAATPRMRELAATPWHAIGAVLIDLYIIFSSRRSDWPKDVEQRVDVLLAEAEANPACEDYRPVLLQYRAKHYLARNDVKEATSLLREALDAGSDSHFGQSRGEIARDLLATEVANNRLISGNHEKPFRYMLVNGMIEGDAPSLEDVAVEAAEYFWDTLYQPYPGYEVKKPMAAEQAEKIIRETFGLIERADWEGLRVWFDKNAKNFRKAPLRHVRGDSLMMIWLKMLHEGEDFVRASVPLAPPSVREKMPKMKKYCVKFRHAICLLIKKWPEQTNLADFKGQTMLMLVADRGDVALVKLLLEEGANVNAQDYRGRTALHAAVCSASAECVAAILASGLDFKIPTNEGDNVLHTAVKMGKPDIVKLLVGYSSLMEQPNHADQTPAQLASSILGGLVKFRQAMQHHRRRIGSEAEYLACANELGLATTA